ncbi:hypothetical protein OFN42_35145, partial [Escherichia coli]|nr:hypothetical protein [Escherichia coli]
MLASVVLLAGGTYFFVTTLDSNLRVINQLLNIDEKVQTEQEASFNQLLQSATRAIQPSYNAWLEGSRALDEEVIP